ncbi:Lrp/AsnC family transcriptional regulator [Ktedonospora formicarum]|uniref:AsnC family transcriptional regulator n=1 Tax=Ktedonospora formicarum TaxID=2778364 RepID=A0A8J3I105_9CHLR|nr:Lrp/AsnC family transcriptional regulator [Ktedonospora formicarum]GHO47339.1 AsnC family transcriptional regulator [Ktedonospora formicarum]
MHTKEFDEIDLKIMRLLEKNARITVASIGKQIAMSAPAVRERIAKLEAKGVITGYQAKFNWEKLNRGTTTFLVVKTEKCQSFVVFCKQSQEITEMHRISGEYNYLLKVQIASMEELTELQNNILLFGSSKSFVGMEQLIPTGGIV